ncbi:MAG TPA: hypothetical protein VG734_24615 [Lacunisphaera sp.]|nr:hypothetical protein [Lacunisphaera sp.]
MKALVAIIVTLSVPLMLLNVLGGLVSGIWLAILGKWSAIFAGLVGMLGSVMLLGFAMMPGILLMVPAAKFAAKENYLGMYVFALGGSAYLFSLIAFWCTCVMWYFMQKATDGGAVPLMIWSYGIALGPLGYMASKEVEDNSSGLVVFFAAIAYVSAGLWVLIGRPSVLNVLVLMGSVLGVGMLTLFASSIAMLRAGKDS